VVWQRGLRSAVRKKVAHIYPAHEVDEFSERFYQAVQVGSAQLNQDFA
jgi:hypothetical protein